MSNELAAKTIADAIKESATIIAGALSSVPDLVPYNLLAELVDRTQTHLILWPESIPSPELLDCMERVAVVLQEVEEGERP